MVTIEQPSASAMLLVSFHLQHLSDLTFSNQNLYSDLLAGFDPVCQILTIINQKIINCFTIQKMKILFKSTFIKSTYCALLVSFEV